MGFRSPVNGRSHVSLPAVLDLGRENTMYLSSGDQFTGIAARSPGVNAVSIPAPRDDFSRIWVVMAPERPLDANARFSPFGDHTAVQSLAASKVIRDGT